MKLFEHFVLSGKIIYFTREGMLLADLMGFLSLSLEVDRLGLVGGGFLNRTITHHAIEYYQSNFRRRYHYTW